MSHVLIVPAIKFSNPMMLFVLVKTNDATIDQLLCVAQSNAEMGMSEARTVLAAKARITEDQGCSATPPT